LTRGNTCGEPVDALPHRLEIEQYCVGLLLIGIRGGWRGQPDHVLSGQLVRPAAPTSQAAGTQLAIISLAESPYDCQAKVAETPMQKSYQETNEGEQSSLAKR
jgi:hypothetical protein